MHRKRRRLTHTERFQVINYGMESLPANGQPALQEQNIHPENNRFVAIEMRRSATTRCFADTFGDSAHTNAKIYECDPQNLRNKVAICQRQTLADYRDQSTPAVCYGIVVSLILASSGFATLLLVNFVLTT